MTTDNTKVLYRSTQFVWYILYVVQTLLAFRFALKFFGANPSAPFTDFIYDLSAIPLEPFRFVFGIENVAGSILEWSTLLAMFVYWLIAAGIVKLIVMNRSISHYEAELGLEAQDKS